MDLPHLVHARLINLFRSPAFHFLLIGGLLFAAVAAQNPAFQPAERERLVIPAYRIELAYRQFMEERRRLPTAEEKQAIIERFVDEEILYRYALRLGLQQRPVAQRRLAKIASFVAANPHEPKPESALAQEALDLGLHHGDLVVRRILIDGAQRLIRAVVLVRQPSPEMLQAYLRDNQESFLTPQQTRITHVVVNRLKHGAQTEAHAKALLEQIRQGAYSPQQVAALGDEPFVSSTLPALPDKDLIRKFGYRFVQALTTVPEHVWSGPIPSRYGLQLVYVHERNPPQLPPLAAIQKQVQQRLLQKLADEWLALRLEQLRQDFEIIVPQVPS